ncbi:hypothetical protein AB1Y20_002780 [Prymnesium parvum]|uniref:NADH dehydrogenase [ubiquinone] 1 alpha subcomplex subunit 11 n=1 Tax=Prymnesium parvum TaxID=97485 RepID=A0AB34J9K6_PRYPA
MRLAAALLLCLGGARAKHAVLSYPEWSARTGSTDRELYRAYDTKVRQRAEPPPLGGTRPPPQSAAQVLRLAWESFAQVGALGFAWTFAMRCKDKLPLNEAARAAQATGVRWGGISAGFAGGTAAAALVLGRKEEDKVCAMIGSAFGGLAAASSLSEVPSSIATFVGFSFVLSLLTEKALDGAPDKR